MKICNFQILLIFAGFLTILCLRQQMRIYTCSWETYCLDTPPATSIVSVFGFYREKPTAASVPVHDMLGRETIVP